MLPSARINHKICILIYTMNAEIKLNREELTRTKVLIISIQLIQTAGIPFIAQTDDNDGMDENETMKFVYFRC